MLPVMADDDLVFKALSDRTRRFLLDLLFQRDGRTLTELESELDMTRFGVMKHLRVLEDAGLVVTRRSGREKLHFLNPVPIQLSHDWWIGKYTERQVSALANLKADLEASDDDSDPDDRDYPDVPGLHQSYPGGHLGCDHQTRVDGEVRLCPGGGL
jgi:DNA-binding transcriptional ArsR family regulator